MSALLGESIAALKLPFVLPGEYRRTLEGLAARKSGVLPTSLEKSPPPPWVCARRLLLRPRVSLSLSVRSYVPKRKGKLSEIGPRPKFHPRHGLQIVGPICIPSFQEPPMVRLMSLVGLALLLRASLPGAGPPV